MKSFDMRGSVFCVAPMESHEFVGVEYECSVCRRPRALHYDTGFKPKRSSGFVEDQTLAISKEFGRSKPRPRNRAMGFRGDDLPRHKAGGKSYMEATREHGTTVPKVRKAAAAP